MLFLGHWPIKPLMIIARTHLQSAKHDSKHRDAASDGVVVFKVILKNANGTSISERVEPSRLVSWQDNSDGCNPILQAYLTV